MIVLVIVRRAVCEVCHGWFDIQTDQKLPERCVICGSPSWQFGPETKDSIFVRTGKAHVEKVLNRGAKSRSRQEWGKKQYQSFKPKPVDSVSDQPHTET